MPKTLLKAKLLHNQPKKWNRLRAYASLEEPLDARAENRPMPNQFDQAGEAVGYAARGGRCQQAKQQFFAG